MTREQTNLPKVGALDVLPNAGVVPKAGVAVLVPIAPKPGVVLAPNDVLPNEGVPAVGVANRPVEGCEVAVRPKPGVAGL